MYELYGNGNYLDTFETEEQAEQGIKDYKEIEDALYENETIQYTIEKAGKVLAI